MCGLGLGVLGLGIGLGSCVLAPILFCSWDVREMEACSVRVSLGDTGASANAFEFASFIFPPFFLMVSTMSCAVMRAETAGVVAAVLMAALRRRI